MKYVIERDMPGVGNLTRDELHAGAARSCQALDALGPEIQWVHSYVTDDKIYCVYIATSEELVRRHAEGSGFPATKISAVRAMIDPTMGEVPAAAR